MRAVTTRGPDEQIETVVRRLTSTLGVPREEIESAVRAAFDGWNDARVRDFVPIFVERELRGRFRVDARGSEPARAGAVSE